MLHLAILFMKYIFYCRATKTVDADSTEAKNVKEEEVKKTESKPAFRDLSSLG